MNLKILSLVALVSLPQISLAGDYYAVKCSSEEKEVKVEFLGRDDGRGDRVTLNGKEEFVLDIGSDSKTERYESASKNFKVIFDTKSGLGTMKLEGRFYSVECLEI